MKIHIHLQAQKRNHKCFTYVQKFKQIAQANTKKNLSKPNI